MEGVDQKWEKSREGLEEKKGQRKRRTEKLFTRGEREKLKGRNLKERNEGEKVLEERNEREKLEREKRKGNRLRSRRAAIPVKVSNLLESGNFFLGVGHLLKCRVIFCWGANEGDYSDWRGRSD